MSNSNNAFVAPGQGDPANVNAGSDKGKGKASEQAAAHDVSMGEEDSSSEDDGDEVTETVDEPDEDNLEEIDTDNIIQGGRRTRGRQIDFAKAAQELPEEDEEDEDDDDFEETAEEDKMEE